ncbi:MAG: Rnf-Nqr domain containing protein [Hydrogenoanaerobacterium sp.]
MSQRNMLTRIRRANRRKALHKFSGIASRNPVLVEGLLLAPVVVATTSLKNAVALSITLAVVTLPTIVLAAMIKTKLPHWLRVPIYAVAASLLLIPAAMLVTPIAPTIFDSMGMYFSLMIFNSVLFTRSERYAVKVDPPQALLDGACYCFGFFIASVPIAALREFLGSNTIWGFPVAIPFKISAIMLPFAGFMLVGMFAAGSRYCRTLILKIKAKRRRVKTPVIALYPSSEGGAS